MNSASERGAAEYKSLAHSGRSAAEDKSLAHGELSNAAALYADGGCINRNPSDIGGTWAWCIADDNDARVWHDSGALLAKYPDNTAPLDYPREMASWCQVTNNLMEFLALLRGVEFLPHGWSGMIASDSMVTLGRFFSNRGRAGMVELPPGIKRMGGSGPWKLNGIPLAWAGRMEQAVDKLGRIKVVLLDGHPTSDQLSSGIGKRGQPVSRHNVWADHECGRVAQDQIKTLSRRGILFQREFLGVRNAPD